MKIRNAIKFGINRIKFSNSNIALAGNVSIFSSLDNTILDKGSRVAAHADVRNSHVGCYSTIGRGSKIQETQIGNFSSISWNVTVNARNHSLYNLTTSAFPYAKRMGFACKDSIESQIVTVGNDVWIGAHAIILPGVSIGDGAVIGAGSVVTKNIPPFSIACGNPAKVIKFRFTDDIIDKLTKLEWWFWDTEKIKNNINFFESTISLELLDKLEKASNA